MKRFLVIVILSCALLLPFFFQPIDLTTEDLGRHLKNGELVFQHPELLKTNFYSYTEQAYAFVNHHWLSGVVFYAINRAVNIQGLMVLYTLMICTALYLTLKRTYDRAGVFATALIAPFLALFFGERHAVRPEGFGLLFLAFFLFYLERAEKRQKLSYRSIAALTAVGLVWVNLHISFIFGIFAVGSYALPYLVTWLRTKRLPAFGKSLLILFSAMCVVSLINPSGIRGALYPLNIFTNYGYDIVENKSMAFLLSLIYDPGIQMYLVFAPLVLLAIGMRAGMKKERNVGELLRVCSGLVLGFIALRNLPIFALFTFPFLAETLRMLTTQLIRSKNMRDSVRIFGALSASVIYIIIVVLVVTGTYHPSISLQSLRLGYVEHQLDSANFFRQLNIQGNMFNNYDIGSYLIYTQFPDHKVFVDNRPEAYSYDFFKKTYIPMQEHDADWQAALKTYDFQSIFFGYHDLTPWGQAFLASRLADPAWKVVYIDDLAIVFVRNTPEHAELIAEHQVLPQDLTKYLRISP